MVRLVEQLVGLGLSKPDIAKEIEVNPEAVRNWSLDEPRLPWHPKVYAMALRTIVRLYDVEPVAGSASL